MPPHKFILPILRRFEAIGSLRLADFDHHRVCERGWQSVDVIPDPPVPGALDFIAEALDVFRVAILSSRSSEPEGIAAMQAWLEEAAHARWRDDPIA